METLAFERTLTELDHVRLTNLIHRFKGSRPRSAPALQIEQLLDAADIVHSRLVPPDVVTMHSSVLLEDLQNGTQSKLTLCYPEQAEPGAGIVSVLSPLGWSVLGQRLGATVQWPTPAGTVREARIVEILFQPESSGDYTM